jgi:glycosyltransferase involved in cell wall biosynthesis
MAITTIITTYQRPSLLKRAINSVLSQTYSDFEVCVYDNASDDETEEIVQAFIKKDSRVKYHRHSRNIGLMPNYKYAFAQLKAPFFSLLSDDDFLLPCFYETALKTFEQFPDAAFSACGIVQMDEKGNLVGDPLSLWRSEGYYLAHEGLIEMLRTQHKFPVPTGVLFNGKILKGVEPNFSEVIDFFWDPDYLIRIAARFPVVITKKPCGVYLAHSQSFSSSFYSRLIQDMSFGEKYLKAVGIVLKGIEESTSLELPCRRFAQKLFKNCIRSDVISFVKTSIEHWRFGVAWLLLKRYCAYYELSTPLIFYHFFKQIIIKTTRKITYNRITRKLIYNRVTRKIIYNRITQKFIRKKTHPYNSTHLKECHEYGQKLLNDIF